MGPLQNVRLELTVKENPPGSELLWQALLRPAGSDRGLWLLPALFTIGGLLWLGLTRTQPESATSQNQPLRTLRIEGQLLSCPIQARGSLRFYANLPEIPLDLYFREARVEWRGDGEFVLQQSLNLPLTPRKLTVEVAGPGQQRKWTELRVQSLEDGTLLAHIPPSTLTATVPPARKAPVRLPRPQYNRPPRRPHPGGRQP